MLISRGRLVLLLVVAAGISYWALQQLTKDEETILRELAHFPDFYMENFSTLTMTPDGLPKNKLNASYMAHYPDDNTTELNVPELEIFQQDKPSIHVRSDKGWVTSNNEVILLSGNVYLYQNNDNGDKQLEVIADDARVLVDEDYAETDKPATLIKNRAVINSIGMRAYMRDQRIEFLSNVQTTIEPKDAPK